jgi:S-adenosylmethionine decarboxylase
MDDEFDFFEGAEKRILICSKENFNKNDIDYWEKMLIIIGCNVLSIILNKTYTFFLLSESSFLVSDKFIMLKTCGKTKPLILLEYINKKFSSITYSHPMFLRPNEQPHPHNDINEEIKILKKYIENIDINIYDKWIICKYDTNNEKFYEMKCWNFFISKNNYKDIHDKLKTIFVESKIDYKYFEPCGYSLNLLENTNYVTIHITPQKLCSYMSIESNNEKINILFDYVIKKFNIIDYCDAYI